MSEQQPVSADGWTRAALVVGGVVQRDGAVLLVHEHTLGGEGPDQWVLPGGRVEPGELLDAAVKREVEEETGLKVTSVGPLAFGSQHYAPGHRQPLLFLAFHAEIADLNGDRFRPDDPDDLIMEARFVPVAEAIELVLSAGVFPGSQSTADFLGRSPGDPPPIWLWDLNRSTDGPLGRIPGPESENSSGSRTTWLR
jgi:8-oxo-dGTP diphosphatase